MSKSFRSFSYVLAAAFQILQFLNISSAQVVDVRISIEPGSKPTAHVEGRFLNTQRTNKPNLAFLREYAGTAGLADRIRGLRLTDASGNAVEAKMLMPGEYLAAADIAGWSYDVALVPLPNALSRAHVSWIDDDRGILMLGDLFPQSAEARRPARVTLQLPNGWEAVSTEPRSSNGTFDISDVDKAVFLITKTGVARALSSQNGLTSTTLLDKWQFTDTDASSAANEIVRAYASILGEPPSRNVRIFMLRLPAGTPAGKWEGDTRGNTVTILSSDMPFASQSRQRLQEQLRHELFHLWFPNGVNLSGNYDWFYEGFALYASLKTGVAANHLSFDNFLDTLARAYDIENTGAARSLIDSSKRRWLGENTALYARGILAAFIVDVALLTHSNGRRSIDSLLREIYQRHGLSTPRTDGNDAVLSAMRKYAELNSVVSRFIIGSDKFDWRDELLAAGIEASTTDGRTALAVHRSPNRRQREILDRLGYNSWRKLSERGR